MEQELDHPLRPLVERLLRLEVVEADQVDEEERREEGEDDQNRARGTSVVGGEPVGGERDEEENRQDVGERDRPGHVPVHLRERDREDGREEERRRALGEPVFTAASRAARRARGRACGATGGRATPRTAVAVGPVREPPRWRSTSRVSGALDVVGRRDDPGTGLADQLGGRAVRRHGGEDRPLGREVLEDLPGEDALAAAARLGDQEQQRLGVALELERRLARRVGMELEPVAEPEPFRPLAVGGRKSPTKRATTSRPDSASAVRNGRGSRLPKKLPVCVIRKRSPRRYSSPAKSSKSQPFAIVVDRPARLERARPPRRSRRTRRRSRRPSGRRAGRARGPSLLRAHDEPLGPPVRVRDDRVAQVGDPAAPVARFTAAPIRCTEFGGDVVRTTSICSCAHDPDRRRNRGQVPADVLVRDEQPAADEPRLAAEPVESLPCRAARRRASGRAARGSARGGPRPASV